MLSCMSCLYILDINPLEDIFFANIFSHSVGGSQNVQLSSHKISTYLACNKPYDNINYDDKHMINIINTAVCYTWIVKRVDPKSSQHRKKKIFSISLILYPYKMMDTPSTYCDNHFMMYVNQILMLYTLKLYSAVCHLYFNKTGRKKYVP